MHLVTYKYQSWKVNPIPNDSRFPLSTGAYGLLVFKGREISGNHRILPQERHEKLATAKARMQQDWSHNKPIGSMHGTQIFTYFYHKNQPNVGKYTIHRSLWEKTMTSSCHDIHDIFRYFSWICFDFPAFSLHLTAPEIHDGDRLYDAGRQMNRLTICSRKSLCQLNQLTGVFFKMKRITVFFFIGVFFSFLNEQRTSWSIWHSQTIQNSKLLKWHDCTRTTAVEMMKLTQQYLKILRRINYPPVN